MSRDAFVKLDADDADDLLRQVNPKLEISAFDPKTATILITPLPFFNGYMYAEITHHGTMPAKTVHALYRDTDVVVLDGTAQTIYDIAKRAPLTLNDKNIAAYVEFFFCHIHGPKGRMLLINTVDDIDWREEPPPSARKALGKMIEPVRLMGRGMDGEYQVIATAIFKNALFQINITVTPDGRADITDQELLVEEIPVLDDVLGA